MSLYDIYFSWDSYLVSKVIWTTEKIFNILSKIKSIDIYHV